MEMKQEKIGAAVEAFGSQKNLVYGASNQIRTGAEETAAAQAVINARAGGADKAAALNDFNQMLKSASPTTASPVTPTSPASPVREEGPAEAPSASEEGPTEAAEQAPKEEYA